jgi:hypothetical protein
VLVYVCVCVRVCVCARVCVSQHASKRALCTKYGPSINNRFGQNHIYTVYYGIFGREITKHTVIYEVYIWFWPTLVLMMIKVCRLKKGTLSGLVQNGQFSRSRPLN